VGIKGGFLRTTVGRRLFALFLLAAFAPAIVTAGLALRFGPDRVRRVTIEDPDAPLPERRWAWRPATR